MNSDLDELPLHEKPTFHTPLSGALLVFRYHLLRRHVWTDLASSMVIFLTTLLAASRLSAAWAESSEYSNTTSDVMSAWLLTSLIVSSIILPFIAAVLGSVTVPAAIEFEMTQSALLTHLKPLDLVLGRLLAGIWPVIAAVLASLAFWLFAQLAKHFVVGSLQGYLPILLGHCILLCVTILSASLSFLFAIKTRPGRANLRGTAAAISFCVFAAISPLLFHPETLRMRNPVGAIQFLLIFNPATAIAASFGSRFDLLRAPGIYEHTSFHDYNFTYPNPIGSLLVFLFMTIVCLAIASVRLRRAYR